MSTAPTIMSTAPSIVPIPTLPGTPTLVSPTVVAPTPTTSAAAPPTLAPSTPIITSPVPTPTPPPLPTPASTPVPTTQVLSEPPQVLSEPPQAPTTTQTPPSFTEIVIESVQTINSTPTTITVTITSTNGPLITDLATTSGTATDVTTTSSGTVGTSGAQSGSSVGGGLSGPALVAVAVIVPVFILAILGIALILYFKKRRRNDSSVLTKGGVMDGTAVAPEEGRDGAYEMDSAGGAGYRGWGSTAGGRKTTVSGSNSAGYPISSVGNTVSDGGYNNSPSPGAPGYVGNASELYTGANAPSSPIYPDSIGLLAAGRVAPSPASESSTMGALPTFNTGGGGLNRGISNASSNYSVVTHSDQSDYDRGQSRYGTDAQEYDAAYFSNGTNMYYDDPSNPPPVIRDVEARRNTRIETPTSAHSPQQGSSGIAQNF